jgi:agmatine/peptidylarginine deiminase
MSAGKLIEPKVITDLNQRVVCLLPVGFYFNDERWEMIWQQYDKKGDTLTMADLKVLFPDEETVQNPAENTGATFNHKK